MERAYASTVNSAATPAVTRLRACPLLRHYIRPISARSYLRYYVRIVAGAIERASGRTTRQLHVQKTARVTARKSERIQDRITSPLHGRVPGRVSGGEYVCVYSWNAARAHGCARAQMITRLTVRTYGPCRARDNDRVVAMMLA